ncbi:MAG: NADPH:quinone oxidoreductase family protein [Aliishimia sp.]
MRAFHISHKGEAPRLLDIAKPNPTPGDLLIEIKACGLNFADLLMIKGTYQETPELPFTLGMEVAGVVRGFGANTDGFEIGQRVAVFGGQGGLADFGVFPADRAMVIPDGMTFEQAAAFPIAYGTSHLALEYRADLQPNETLVVLGAAGGVGLTAVEIGKKMGARVIAVARGAEKLAIARAAGADHLIDAEVGDLRQALLDLGGVDVVYDPVGGDGFTSAFRACNPEARILTIGFASGEVPQIKANHLLVKNINVIGFYWGGYMRFNPEILLNSLRTLAGWIAQGTVTPHISNVLPLTEAAVGLELLRTRNATGKVVITP